MALALQNPKPGTLRRFAQFAQARGIDISQALDHAGFAKGTPLQQRGGKAASAAWKAFFYVGKKGGKARFASGKFGAAGSRGGKVTKTAVRQAEHAYEERFGPIKRVSTQKARITKMSAEDALRHRLRTRAKELYRVHEGNGRTKGFPKSLTARKISKATATELRAMAQSIGVSDILVSQAKRQKTQGKQRAHAEKFLSAFRYTKGKNKGVRASASGKRPATGSKTARYQDARGRFASASNEDIYAKGNKSRARRNALALQNPLALQNALALENSSLMVMQQFAVGYALPLAAGGALGAVLHGALTALDAESKLVDGALKIPVVGEYLARGIEMAPFTTQGVLAGAGFLVVASLTSGKLRAGALAAAASTITVGAALDTFSSVLPWFQGKLAGDDSTASPATLTQSELGALALENVSALGALALENGIMQQNYGDGFAYELGRLGGASQNLGAHDYGQAIAADAYHSAHDFNEVEGQALANGRDAWLHTFGAPPHRQHGQQGMASHLAGRPGHQWGWLIQTLGYDDASRLCALPAPQRVAVIAGLRDVAKQVYQRLMLEQQAMAVQAGSPQIEFSPAAGLGAQGAAGASGGAMGATYLGDPNVVFGA